MEIIMLKKSASKTIDINTQIVEELLSKSEPSELFGKDGIFNQLKKQIVERVLEKELDHELGYSQQFQIWPIPLMQAVCLVIYMYNKWIICIFTSLFTFFAF